MKKKARSSSPRAGIRLTSKITSLCSAAGLAGAIALQAPFAFGKTAVGIDLGYHGLSLRTDLDPETFVQFDLGSGWFYGGVSVGADYCKIYPRKKGSSVEPDIFYGFGAEVYSLGGLGLVAGRLPFGVNWHIKATPLEIGVAAVPHLVFGDSATFVAVGLSVPFRWVLN